MRKLIKTERKVKLKKSRLFNINPKDWVYIDRCINPLGCKQERYSLIRNKGLSKFYAYFNWSRDGSYLESIFLSDERFGASDYIAKKRIKFRPDRTISSVTIFHPGDKKSIYCFKTCGLVTFKVIFEYYVEDVVEFSDEQKEQMMSEEFQKELNAYINNES